VVDRKRAKPSKSPTSEFDFKIVEREYDQFCLDYEALQKGIRYQAPQLILRHLARHIPREPLLLDIGCGSGLFGLFAKKRLRGCSITGTDLSGGMLEQAGKKGVYSKLIKSDLSRGLPFPENSFDAAVCVGVLEYFKDLKVPLSEMARVSRNVIGLYVLLFPCGGFNSHTKDRLFAALASVGYTPVDVFTFEAYSRAISLGVIAAKIGDRGSAKPGKFAFKSYFGNPQ
jgi:ubiquinone/menaquinone biosynthesis C-methylase UbiE